MEYVVQAKKRVAAAREGSGAALGAVRQSRSEAVVDGTAFDLILEVERAEMEYVNDMDVAMRGLVMGKVTAAVRVV